MSAQVSKGSTNPERLTAGWLQPSSSMSALIQIWNACVATVFTRSTMACQRGSRATISLQTWGMAPRPTPRTTTSKSSPARAVLVEGREHDVAHARLHAPEERAAVGEERARHAAERLTRGDARPRRVAVLVGEAEVVEPAKVARVERRVGRAVHPQPFATVVVVDRVEAARVGEEMVPDDAAQRGERQVGDRPQAAEREVALGARL